MVATSLIERALDAVVPWFADRCPRGLERHVEPCLTPPRALSDVLTCRVVVFCAEFPQSEAYIACVKYVHKYISKPDRFVTSRLHCAAKWHEQARMLSHALPVDVVRVIGAHVCERAAIMLQKWMRGASVRLAWVAVDDGFIQSLCSACIPPNLRADGGSLLFSQLLPRSFLL